MVERYVVHKKISLDTLHNDGLPNDILIKIAKKLNINWNTVFYLDSVTFNTIKNYQVYEDKRDYTLYNWLIDNGYITDNTIIIDNVRKKELDGKFYTVINGLHYGKIICYNHSLDKFIVLISPEITIDPITHSGTKLVEVPKDRAFHEVYSMFK